MPYRQGPDQPTCRRAVFIAQRNDNRKHSMQQQDIPVTTNIMLGALLIACAVIVLNTLMMP